MCLCIQFKAYREERFLPCGNCDNCNGLALTQSLFLFLIFVIMFLISSYTYETEKWGSEKRNGFLICKNEERNEFIFENWNGSAERAFFNIKKIYSSIRFDNNVFRRFSFCVYVKPVIIDRLWPLKFGKVRSENACFLRYSPCA